MSTHDVVVAGQLAATSASSGSRSESQAPRAVPPSRQSVLSDSSQPPGQSSTYARKSQVTARRRSASTWVWRAGRDVGVGEVLGPRPVDGVAHARCRRRRTSSSRCGASRHRRRRASRRRGGTGWRAGRRRPRARFAGAGIARRDDARRQQRPDAAGRRDGVGVLEASISMERRGMQTPVVRSCVADSLRAASQASNSARRALAIGNTPTVLSPAATRSAAHSSSSSCLQASAATSTTSAAGTITTPSPSPTTTSPGSTVTPAQAIGTWCSSGRCRRPNVAA